jgi:hypothetical protein
MNYEQRGTEAAHFAFGIESADEKRTDQGHDSAGDLARAAKWRFQDDSGTSLPDGEINGYCGAKGLPVNHNLIRRVTRGTKHFVSSISVGVQTGFSRATLASSISSIIQQQN